MSGKNIFVRRRGIDRLRLENVNVNQIIVNTKKVAIGCVFPADEYKISSCCKIKHNSLSFLIYKKKR